MSNEGFTIGSLYIAGFTQARAPHIGLLLATNENAGCLVHIRIDRTTSTKWQYQTRKQNIDHDMFLSSLLRVHDASLGTISENQLCQVAQTVLPPDNDSFGECAPWVYQVLQKLHDQSLLYLSDIAGLAKEMDELARNSRGYARRDKFPNVAISQFCQ